MFDSSDRRTLKIKKEGAACRVEEGKNLILL